MGQISNLQVAYGDVVERGGIGFYPSQSTRFSSIASTSNCSLGNKGSLLWTIFATLLFLWLLGLVTSYTLGGFIHILLVLAVATVLIPGHPRPKDCLTATG
jgi:hypothetical protein